VEPAFVGRERELATLHEALSGASAGAGRALWLSGDPGIGKTRLASHFAAMAIERGARVVWGRCQSRRDLGPYSPWSEIVQAILESGDPEVRRAQMGAGAADLATILSSLRAKYADIPAAPAIEATSARMRLFASVIDFVAAVAREQPAVIILDDVHEADEASLRLLAAFSARLRRMPLLLVATFRTLAPSVQPSLAKVLAGLPADCRHLILEPLASAHVAALLAQLWGGPVVPTPTATVAALCAGNPFYATQCARLMRTSTGRSAALHDSLPTGLHGVLQERLDALGDATRRALGLLAVAGPYADLGFLDAVWQSLPAGRGGEPIELRASILEGAQAGLLVLESNGTRVRFVHALIEEAVYERVDRETRVLLHGAVGEVLLAWREAGVKDIATRGMADVLAHHFYRAEPASERTARLSWEAAEHAVEQLAYEDAANHCEHLMAALSSGLDGSILRPWMGTTDGSDAVGELWLRLAELRWKAGDLRAVETALANAAQRARDLREDALHAGAGDGDPRFAAALQLLARAALGCGQGAAGVPTGDVDRRAVARIEEALRLVPISDSALRVRLMGRLAEQLYYDASTARRRDDLSRNALAMARRLQDPMAVAGAIASRLWATNGPDNLPEHLRLGAELAVMTERAGLPEAMALTKMTQATNLMEVGDVVAADACIAAHAEVAENLRQPVLRWQQQILRAMRAQLSGRFVEAAELSLAAREMGGSLRSDFEQLTAAQLFVIYREVDRLQELEPMVRELAASSDNIPAWRAALANLYARSGRQAEARAELNILGSNEGFADIPRNVHFLLSMALLTDTIVELPEAPAAASLYEMLRPFAGRNISTSGVIVLGAVDRYLGALAARLDQFDAAAAHFDAALQFNARQGAWPYLAHTQREYGAMLVRRSRGGRGSRTRGIELLRQALGTYESLGMSASATQTRSLLGWSPATPMATTVNRIRFVDGRWRVEYAGTAVEVGDSNGMRYLAALLRERTLRVNKLVAHSRRQASRRTDDEEQMERDRKSVTKAIKRAIAVIADGGHTALARHLFDSIRTGGICRYRPGSPTDWEV